MTPGRLGVSASFTRWVRRSVLLVVFCLGVTPLQAQNRPATAEQVKAAYLLKFPNFVSWPSNAFQDASSAFAFAVLDADEVFAELSKQALGREVQGRPVLVRRITRIDPNDPVHVLYIGSPVTAWRTPVAGLTHTLVVASTINALDRGAIINFMIVDGRVRFELSLPSAQQARLRLGSQLIEVAERVRSQTP